MVGLKIFKASAKGWDGWKDWRGEMLIDRGMTSLLFVFGVEIFNPFSVAPKWDKTGGKEMTGGLENNCIILLKLNLAV